MSTVSAAPAWPRRPPVWSSLALLASFLLALFYCRVEIAFMPGNQGKLLPTYIKSAAWRYVPPMPSLHKRVGPPTHKFVLPDGSSLQLPAAILYNDLRRVVYGGTSVLGVFQACVHLLRVDSRHSSHMRYVLRQTARGRDPKWAPHSRSPHRQPMEVQCRNTRLPIIHPMEKSGRPVETSVDPDPGRTSVPAHKSALRFSNA